MILNEIALILVLLRYCLKLICGLYLTAIVQRLDSVGLRRFLLLTAFNDLVDIVAHRLMLGGLVPFLLIALHLNCTLISKILFIKT